MAVCTVGWANAHTISACRRIAPATARAGLSERVRADAVAEALCYSARLDADRGDDPGVDDGDRRRERAPPPPVESVAESSSIIQWPLEERRAESTGGLDKGGDAAHGPASGRFLSAPGRRRRRVVPSPPVGDRHNDSTDGTGHGGDDARSTVSGRSSKSGRRRQRKTPSQPVEEHPTSSAAGTTNQGDDAHSTAPGRGPTHAPVDEPLRPSGLRRTRSATFTEHHAQNPAGTKDNGVDAHTTGSVRGATSEHNRHRTPPSEPVEDRRVPSTVGTEADVGDHRSLVSGRSAHTTGSVRGSTAVPPVALRRPSGGGGCCS